MLIHSLARGHKQPEGMAQAISVECTRVCVCVCVGVYAGHMIHVDVYTFVCVRVCVCVCVKPTCGVLQLLWSRSTFEAKHHFQTIS